MPGDALIFVFAEVSCGLTSAILAEFAPVPNAPSDVATSQFDWAPVSVAATLPTPASGVSAAVQPVESLDRIERGGPAGPEPTRFGDWERNGRCIDF